jgi:glycerol-3-phosphate dehydrogenase
VTREANGLTRVSGGKYTTYRVMARDAVDVGAADGSPAPSRTADLRLVGAAAPEDLRRLAERLGRETGLDAETTAALVARHGTEASAVASLGAELDLLRPLGSGPAIEAEVAWAARAELARSLDDVLSRRLRASMIMPDRGASVAPRVDELVGRELGWDPAGREARVAEYLAGARREYDLPAA